MIEKIVRSKIRWKILQCDAPEYLGLAKSQVRRMWQGGTIGFHKKLIVNGIEIELKSVKAPGCILAYISIVGGVTHYDSILPLGSLNALFAVTKSKAEPISPTGQFTYPSGMPRAQIAKPMEGAVSYSALYYPGNTNLIVSFISLSGFWNTLIDANVGAIQYYDAVSNIKGMFPVKFDFGARLVWFSTTTQVSTFSAMVTWLAFDMDAYLSGYTATFKVQTDADGNIPDGPQIFQLPLAEGRINQPITVTFKDGFEVGVANPPVGSWTTSIVSISISKDADITIGYKQFLSGASTGPVLFVKDVKEFIPIGDTTSFGTYQYLHDVLLNDAPVAVIGYETNTGGIITSDGEIRNEQFRLIMSDGTDTEVSTSDPTMVYTASALGGPGPTLTAPIIFRWYGPNGEVFEYDEPSIDFGASIDGATWDIEETNLGFTVHRSVPSRSGFSISREQYDIIFNGETVRTNLRDRVTTIGGGPTLLERYVVSGNPNWVLSGNKSRVARLTSSSLFTMYDQPYVVPNVRNDLCVVVDVNLKTGVRSNVAVALLPPGWTKVNDYRSLLFITNPPDASTALGHIKQGIDDELTYLGGADEVSDLIARLDSMKNVVNIVTSLTTTSVVNDIVASINAVIGAFNVFASATADQDFAESAATLVKEYTDPTIARDTPLTMKEIRFLFVGYLSAHMNRLANASSLPYSLFLMAGPGNFVRATGL